MSSGIHHLTTTTTIQQETNAVIYDGQQQQESSLDVARIQAAIQNSLSTNQQLRDEAFQYLTYTCEPNPKFQIVLLHLIRQLGQVEGQHSIASPEQTQMQFQVLVCMKNSLTRLLQQNRGRFQTQNSKLSRQIASASIVTGAKFVHFGGIPSHQKNGSTMMTEEMRNQIKQELLDLIASPENIILSKNSYDQLTLVATIFVKYDFPANWPQMNQWVLTTFEQLFNNMQNLQLEDVPRVERFLGFYYEVLKEQTKKQLTNSRSQFIKVAKDHLRVAGKVWQFFNDQQCKMMFTNESNQINFQDFNETIFSFASKLDKILMLIVKCGFSITNLLSQPENNCYVETVSCLIKKLKQYTDHVELLSQMGDSEQKQDFLERMISQVKTFLRRLSDLQESENFLMYNSLDKYLMILANLLFRSELYNQRVNKLALIATFRMVKTEVYNAKKDISGHHDGIGMIVSPVKFKNLEPQIQIARDLYAQVMEPPILNSQDEREQTRQDGARKIYELVAHKFLSQVDLSSWQSDPEYFLQNEDEQFLVEFDLQDDNSINLLAQHLIEKLLQKFYPIIYPFTQEILNQYFQGHLVPPQVQVEDALLNLVGIVGKVQRENRVKQEKLLDIGFVLRYIKDNKWQGNSEFAPIFKRRFLLILTHWVRIMPKPIFFELFQTICQSLSQTGSVELKTGKVILGQLETVLVYEHCHCIHEMLKEIQSWLQRGESLKQGNSIKVFEQLPKDIGELRGIGEQKYSDSEDEQIDLCNQINSQINYSQLFQLVCVKLTALFDVFKSPNLIWTMCNFLSMILEQCLSQPEQIDQCLQCFNIIRILETETEDHVYEAILDMIKNLLIICPNSPIILNICCDLLDFKLNISLNDYNTITFWLFTMRTVSETNQNLGRLKEIFVKYSGCLAVGPVKQAPTTLAAVSNIKRDYIYQEFLQVAQEGVMLGMFDSLEESSQLMKFVTQKFESEIKLELENMQKLKATNGNNDGFDEQESSSFSEDGNNLDEAMYEKKANLIQLMQIILYRAESAAHIDQALQNQKQFLLCCCIYLIESKAVLTLPGSNVLFQALITYINRVLITKQNEFINGILVVELGNKGYSLKQFILALLNKMDHIVSWEAHRIKTLTLLTLLPYFDASTIQECFSEFGRLCFSRLEEDLFLKLSDQKEQITYSPNRFKQKTEQDMSGRTNALKIRLKEKFSQRWKNLTRDDWLLGFDQIDIFWQKVRELMQKLNIQTIDPLLECLTEDDLKNKFSNLVNGFSPRFEAKKNEQLQLQQQALSEK